MRLSPSLSPLSKRPGRPRFLSISRVLAGSLVLLGLACLGAVRAEAAPAPTSIQVYASGLEGNWVGIRPTGSGERYTVVSDHTPCYLDIPPPGLVPSAAYDIRVENRGWLTRYADEKIGITSNDTELRPFNLRPAGANPTAVVAGVVVALAVVAILLAQSRRSRFLQQRLEVTMSEKQALAEGKMTASDTLPVVVGRTLETKRGERFEILRIVGKGNMGAVFEASAHGPGRPYGERWAVKVPFRDCLESPETYRRFLREAEICIRLPHAGLVQVLDQGSFDPRPEEEIDAWPFIVMEMMDDTTLRDVMDAEGRQGLPWKRVVGWLGEMAAAMKCMHAADVVHRDLKPQNVFVTSAGHVKIGDFGLAGRVDRHSMTQSGDALGTPLYMSPEHLEAKETVPASDMFSLGVMAYEMLCGRPPFQADNPFVLFRLILNEDPVPLAQRRPDLPEGLLALVKRMMDRDARRRPTADELLRALQQLGSSASSSRSGDLA